MILEESDVKVDNTSPSTSGKMNKRPSRSWGDIEGLNCEQRRPHNGKVLMVGAATSSDMSIAHKSSTTAEGQRDKDYQDAN